MSTKKLLPLGILWLGALSSTVQAQCLGPDGLSGPCCAIVPANLPPLSDWAISGTSICFNSCQPTQENNRIQFGTPNMITCGQYSAGMTVFDSTGIAILTGTVSMDYTRTWEEFVPVAPPQQYQVYRFAVKVDLNLAGGLGNPCNTPACLPSTGTAFYYGYMDYAFECGTTLVQNSLVLFHNCDLFIHKSSLSSLPGTYHPGTSYALVWPSTPANPFIAAGFGAPGGPLAGEATRLMPIPGAAACVTEDPLASGAISPVGNGCACPLSSGPIQTTGRKMSATGTCVNTAGMVSSYTSLNLTPNFPWFEVMTNSIGFWTTLATYPGDEQVWVDEGVFLVRDACSDVLTGQYKFGEIYYGGSTSNGYPVMPSPVNPTITQNLTDLAANTTRPLPGPITFPLVGTVMPTRSVMYMNF